MVTRSTWRSRLTVLTTLAALLLPASSVPAAVADDAITHQDYADTFRFAELREKGYTGKGVTIAYVEAPPDLSVPELQGGANIEVRSRCEMKFSLEDTAHSTAVASILANKDWGWSPEATIINYAAESTFSDTYDTNKEICGETVPTAIDAINQALSDGVDIISLSISLDSSVDGPTYARAALLGVPIIAGTGNDGVEDQLDSIAQYNTVQASAVSAGNSMLPPFARVPG